MFPQSNTELMNDTRDYAEEVITSPFALDVYREILRGNAKFTTKIAKNLDSKPQSVSNYIKGLRDKGLIKKSEKNGRVVIYEVVPEALFDLWNEIFLHNDKEAIESIINEIDADEYIKDEISVKAERFVVSLIMHRIYYTSGSTFDEIVVDFFMEDFIDACTPHHKNMPQWLIEFYIGIEQILGGGEFSENVYFAVEQIAKDRSTEETLHNLRGTSISPNEYPYGEKTYTTSLSEYLDDIEE